MERIEIDVGKEVIKFEIPDGFTYEILTPNEFPVVSDLKQEVKRALDFPISSRPIRQIVQPGNTVSLIINDNTRYVPQDIIVPEILDELVSAGIREEDITIVIATGTHRPNTREEIIEMIGEEIPGRFRIINHSAYDDDNLVNLGQSENLQIPIVLNKTVVESDIKIGIGVIEPHLFAGYSGGVKILSVGVAGIDTIAATHNAKMLEHSNTKFGVTDNNIFREFLNEVADIAGLNFIVNVVQNGDKEVLGVFAGNPIRVHEEGVEFAKKVYEVKASRQADIVISVPKYPKTINLYQATRAANGIIFGEKPLVKKDGVLIMPARCWDGLGSKELYDDLTGVEDPKELIVRAREKGFPPEGHKPFSIARMLQQCKIYITDTDIPEETIKSMHLNYAKSVTEALQQISRKYYDNIQEKHIAILPDGIITIPKLTG
jgi:nickel-dependent lactate racemase